MHPGGSFSSELQLGHHTVGYLIFLSLPYWYFPHAVHLLSVSPVTGSICQATSNLQTKSSSIHKEEKEKVHIGLRCLFPSPLLLYQIAMHVENYWTSLNKTHPLIPLASKCWWVLGAVFHIQYEAVLYEEDIKWKRNFSAVALCFSVLRLLPESSWQKKGRSVILLGGEKSLEIQMEAAQQ